MQEFYTALEAAPIVGVSEKTIRKRIRAGEIPAEKIRLKSGQESWQIPVAWVTENAVSSPAASGSIPAGAAEHHGGRATEATENKNETPPEAPSEPAGTSGSRSDSVPPDRALGRLEGFAAAQLAKAVSDALEPLQSQLAAMSESNRAQREMIQAQSELLARMEKQLAQSAAERESAIREAAEAAAKAALEPIQKAQEEIVADNRRLAGELEAEKARSWWDKLRGKG